MQQKQSSEAMEESTSATGLRLSQNLPASFVESKLDLEAVVLGDDATRQVQEMVDTASRSRVPLIWDKAVCLSDTIRIGSHTEIRTLDGKGAVLAEDRNRAMFMNKNIRFRENEKIVDEDIIFKGGIWNGNGECQTSKGDSERGMSNIFSWYGVRGLTLSGHRMYTPKVYCQHATNIQRGLIDDFVVDVGSRGAINMDGVHFDGWCNQCRISRGIINAHDDGVGCNADDLYYDAKFGNGCTKGFWVEDPCGPVSDITIEDIEFKSSLFGIRILSGQSRVDNIAIKNIRGKCFDYCILIDNYWRDPGAVWLSGPGNIGRITIDDVSVEVFRKGFYDSQDAVISLSCSVEELRMCRIAENTGDVPLLAKYASGDGLFAFKYGQITLDGHPIT